jgi:serine/threonine-protein kinase
MNSTKAPSFTDRLLSSRLLEPAQIAAARAAVGDDERELALYLVRQKLLTAYQTRQLRAGSTGFYVGKYIVVDLLGRGGHSIVFKARHSLIPQRYVALKTLDTENLHYGEEALARFRQEIAIVSCLEHPNIVRAYDLVQTRTQLFLVLEYVAGRDLASRVRDRGPLPIREAVEHALQAARALAYAHGKGVIHRDLKPSNLLRTREGIIKLSDLGLARLLTPDQLAGVTTVQGSCMGTPEYMAPEQAEDASRADARSDLYSLGTTLFHLLTGQSPVNGSSYLHCMKRLLLEAPRPLADARPDVPAELAVVVDRLRSRDPKDRPASAKETIALLEPFARRQVVDDPRRWDGRQKAALVLEVLQGKTTAAEACTTHGLTLAEFERWRRKFLEGAQQALDPAAPSGASSQQGLRELNARLMAQAAEIDRLKNQLSPTR